MSGFLKGSTKDNSRRKFSGGGNRPDRARYKREDAEKRHADWATLSPSLQLEELDRRLGKGVGAKRQRARIFARMQKTEARQSPQVANDQKIDQSPKVKAKDRREAEKSASKQR